MDDRAHAMTTLDGLEVGMYRQDGGVVVYLNQAGICLMRQHVEPLTELEIKRPGGLSIATLRRIGKRLVAAVAAGHQDNSEVGS